MAGRHGWSNAERDQKDDNGGGNPEMLRSVEEMKTRRLSAVVFPVPGLLAFGDCRKSRLARNLET